MSAANSFEGVAHGERSYMHQPPNPDDMRRVPPANPACARVRARLRDYADGDLNPAQVSIVDEHVQICRTCAVELVRAEHEVLRLRRAFAAIGTEQESLPGYALRADFAARVVEQLVLTDGARLASKHADSSVDAAASSGNARASSGDARASSGAVDASGLGDQQMAGGRLTTSRLLGRRVSAADAQSSRELEMSMTSPAGMLVSALLTLFVLAIGLRVWDSGDDSPQQVARLVIQGADDCFGANKRRLSIGDIVGDRQGLWVQRGGGAKVDWNDVSELIQPAATIDLQSGEVQLRNGAPLLVGGKALIETNRGVELPMADGSRLSLGVGEYLVTAIPADMVEDGQFAPDEDLGFGLEGKLRIAVEVLSGQPAKILSAGSPSGVLVSAGSVANYQAGGPIDVSLVGRLATDASGSNVPRVQVSEVQSVMAGHLVGPNGQPGVGALVLLRYGSDGQERSVSDVTGANGLFRMPTEGGCESKFAIVFSLPNVERPDLGIIAEHAAPLWLQGNLAQFEQSIQIGRSTEVHGIVTDDSNAPRQGVKVIPVVVDELFGSAYALLTFGEFKTGLSGRFKITQLPSFLPAHQRLVLLLSHELLEPTVVPLPLRGSEVASSVTLTLVAPRLHEVGMYQLPAGTSVTIFEEVPGLPAGSAAVRRTISTNGSGAVVEARVGRGRMWLATANEGLLSEMLLMQLGAGEFYHPSINRVPRETRLRPLQPLGNSEIKLVNSRRYEHVQVAPIPDIGQSKALRVRDAFYQSVARAEVFAVRQSACYGQPDPRFLGFTGDNGVLSLGAVADDEDVLVIGPDGGLAAVTRPSSLVVGAGQTLELYLQATGRVLLDPSLQPAPTDPDRRVVLTFYRNSNEMLAGMQPVAVRFATDGQWEVRDVPAGTYMVDVRGTQYPLVVPSTGFVLLKAD